MVPLILIAVVVATAVASTVATLRAVRVDGHSRVPTRAPPGRLTQVPLKAEPQQPPSRGQHAVASVETVTDAATALPSVPAALTPVPTASDLEVYRGLFQSMTGYDGTAAADGQVPLQVIKNLQKKVAQFHLSYKFAIDELTTKIEILQEEFEHTHDYSPIEHVRTRLKSMDSIIEKVQRTGTPPDVDHVRARIRDIAGVRITCAFVADAYWVAEMLTRQSDIHVVEVKDYIANPKPNGYQSLHLIVTVPVFLSDRTELVPVEIQLRTIAMDFWASLEHKIYYKYDRDVPAGLVAELTEAADAARALDAKMARLRDQVRELD